MLIIEYINSNKLWIKRRKSNSHGTLVSQSASWFIFNFISFYL